MANQKNVTPIEDLNPETEETTESTITTTETYEIPEELSQRYEEAKAKVQKLKKDPMSPEFQEAFYAMKQAEMEIFNLAEKPTILTRIKKTKPAQFIARHKKASAATGIGLAALGIFAFASTRDDEEEDLDETDSDTTEEVEVTEF